LPFDSEVVEVEGVSCRRRWGVVLILLYTLWLAGIVAGLVYSRQSALARLSQPQAQRQWDAWRDDVRRNRVDKQGVTRRIPKSDQPACLVLMRDHFAAMLIGAIVFGTLLFAVTSFFALAAFKHRS